MGTILDALTQADLVNKCNALDARLAPGRAQIEQIHEACAQLEQELAALEQECLQIDATHRHASAEWNADVEVSDEALRTHARRASWLLQLPSSLSAMTREQKTLLLLLTQRTAARTFEHGLRKLDADPAIKGAFAKRAQPVALMDRFIALLEQGDGDCAEALAAAPAASPSATARGASIRPEHLGLNRSQYERIAQHADEIS